MPKLKFKFFITPVYPYGNDHYYHEIIALAEGLSELGYDISANVDYWIQPEKNNSFLLKENSSDDYDVAIYDHRYVRSFEHLLFRKGYPNFKSSAIKILIDRNEEWNSPIWNKNDNYKIFDVIFSEGLLSNISYAENVKPWAMGLTNRIINSIDTAINKNETEKFLGHNFRVPHNMRSYVLENLKRTMKKYPVKDFYTEEDSLKSANDIHYWNATSKRHYPDFYKQLNSILMFASFGGYYECKPITYAPYNFTDKIMRKPFFLYSKFLEKRNKDISPAVFVFQYDNFRFWEVLYSMACPVNLNFESWNFLLPENPMDGEHYLGIKKFNFKEFVERLDAMSAEQIQKIGLAGRKWALEKYSPAAQANRMLQHIEKQKK